MLATCLLAASWIALGQVPARAPGALPSRAQPLVEPRIALVIGNADYPGAPLVNPINDARAIAARLAELGFHVTRLENASQGQMYDAIRVFGDQLRDGGAGLFYYAGHAVQMRGRNYLLPARAVIEREDEIVYRTVDTGQILDKMDSARNRVNIVVLDACRNNPFWRTFRNIAPGLAVVDAPANTLIAFATAPGAVASDGTGRNGLYTQHLLRALASPGLSLEDVFKRVRAGVRQESAGRQVPWENTSLEVDFFFDPLPSQTASAVPDSPEPLIVELAFWDSVKGSSDPEDYRAYLKRYPQGQFAALANNRLRALNAAAPVAAASAAAATALTLQAPGPAASAPAQAPANVARPELAPPAAPAASVGSPALATVPSITPSRAMSGHGGEVLAIALSRQGTHALTGAADASLRYWDAVGGRELRRFLGHAGAVTAVAIAGDSRWLLSGGADFSVRLWDVASGAELARLMGHGAPVSAVAFDPTSRYAISTATDGEIILWQLPSGQPIRRGRADRRPVTGATLSPEGRYLLTASGDGAVQLWEVGSLQVVRNFGPLPAAALAAGFGEGGRRVHAVDGNGGVWSWETTTGALVRRFDAAGRPPLLAAIASDGAAALTGGADGRLALWDIAAARAAWQSNLAGRRPTALAVGPGGAHGLSASDDWRLQLWISGR